jgi:hypothetical protein
MGEKEEYWKSELKPIVFKELAAFEEAERMARKWVTLQ